MPDIAAIVAEFEAELATVAKRYAGRPADEVRHLWGVALERESLVAVAYRRDIIGGRLNGMPIDESARAVVARAIQWAWRDEEMHALWIRGILLREGHRLQRLRAWRGMVEGRLAGWTSSRQAHLRWSEAPLKRAVAEALEVGGRITGRVPETVGRDLHFQSFADYCQFNVGAERTAELAWRRLFELAEDPAAEVTDEDTAVFGRIADDEIRHGRIFAILQDAFRPDDSLRPGVDAATLQERIAMVGQRFLALPSEGDGAWSNPLGKGAPVLVREGPSVKQLLDEVLDGLPFAVPPGSTVAVKTTFMYAVTRDDPSPRVSLDLLHALTTRLKAKGCRVLVVESQNIYDRFHQHRGVAEVAAHFAVPHPSFTLCDAQADQAGHPFLRGFGPGTVCAAWRDADVRIVLGKLRSHPTDQAFFSLDTVEGLGGRHDAFSFSDRKADRHTAILAVADAFPPHLALLDAFSDVPDGLAGMMGCPRPLQPRRLYASTDAVALDVVAARHLGLDPEDLLLSAAFDWFGDPRERLSVDGVDTPIDGWSGPGSSPASAALSALALPLWDHASAKGALFVPTMDDAFPPITTPHPVFAAARGAAMRVLSTGARAHHPPIHTRSAQMHVVIGAGMGGLAAAIELANQGRAVTVIEARSRVGGLAGGVSLDGRTYDGGPHILLDRPGLEWVFESLGVDLAPLRFLPLDEPWRVRRPDGPSISVFRDRNQTAQAMEGAFPGSAKKYLAFVAKMAEIYDRLVPLQRGEPGLLPLIRSGAFRSAPFLLQGLGRHLQRTGLADPIVDALGIWTHIAGQPLADAPAPLALVPAIVHTRGAWTVEGGIHKIPELLADHARALGVEFRLGERVTRIVRDGRRILGVEVDGERIEAKAVISGAAGVGTYVQLLDPPDPAMSSRLSALPLQSPGVAAYLGVRDATAPFLQFFLPPGELCRVLIYPGAVDPTRATHARLLSPTDHAWAARVGPDGQNAHLDALLAEDWWHGEVPTRQVLERRIPTDWGRRYFLYRDSMNPVMTARFMRKGRIPHTSPVADNLFLAGSSTHPGQWVSFCAISGILAARAAVSG